jgi:hypothetical protein
MGHDHNDPDHTGHGHGTSDSGKAFAIGVSSESLALKATALGICDALLNQPVEVGAVQPQFAAPLGLCNLRPDLVVRFGWGPTLPLSMGRPADSALI